MQNSETRAFKMTNGVAIEDILNAIDSYCKSKQMKTQYNQTPDGGYVFQAAQESVWKTALGMRVATTVQLNVIGDTLNVSIGAGEWMDKIGSTVVGLFIAWPLLLTAGYGAYMQKKFPSELFTVIDCTLSGRPVMTNNAMSDLRQMNPFSSNNYTAQTNNTVAKTVVCPNCGSDNNENAKFCSQCGKPLNLVCPNCGKNLRVGTKFCPECGTKTE